MAQLLNTDIVRTIQILQKDGKTPLNLTNVTDIWIDVYPVNDIENKLVRFQYPDTEGKEKIEIISAENGQIRIVVSRYLNGELTSYAFEMKYKVDGFVLGESAILFNYKKSSITGL